MDWKMTFGKYQGKPVDQIDLGYLIWCKDTLKHCPTYILDELLRRGQTTQTTKQRKKKARIQRQAVRQRTKAAEKVGQLKLGVQIPNPNFDRLREEYVKAGGNLDDCPFNTDDYTYTGPGFVGLTKPQPSPEGAVCQTSIPDLKADGPQPSSFAST